MTNTQIKNISYTLVDIHEKKAGRTVKKIENYGYDLLSKSNNKDEIRHIEVKGTTKSKLNFRWLEEKQYNALLNDEYFYLYIVLGVGSNSPRIIELKKDQILNYITPVQKYEIKLSQIIPL